MVKENLTNTSWLVGGQVVENAVALGVGVWVARYLGPNQFGLLGYVLAYVTMLRPIARLGLSPILARDLVDSDNPATPLSNTLILQTTGSSLSLAIAIVSIWYVKRDYTYVVMAALVATSLVFESSEGFKAYFIANGRARTAALCRTAGMLSGATVRVLFILIGASVIWFASAITVQAMAIALLLGVTAFRSGLSLRDANMSFTDAKRRLYESWPLILASYGSLINIHFDKIMIGELLTATDVGIYEAASRLTTAGFFLPATIVASVQPALIRAYRRSFDEFRRKMHLLMGLLVLLAALPVAILLGTSDIVVAILYGPEYEPTAVVLKVHALSLLIVFVGVPRGVWRTIESRMKFQMFATFLGAASNILLNFLFLPLYGALGAAYATLISYFIMYIGSGLLHPPARKFAMWQLQALVTLGIYPIFRYGLRRLP